MLKLKSKSYETEEEDWAFSDGVSAGVKAMCEKYKIDESDVYKKEDSLQEQTKQTIRVDEFGKRKQ